MRVLTLKLATFALLPLYLSGCTATDLAYSVVVAAAANEKDQASGLVSSDAQIAIAIDRLLLDASQEIYANVDSEVRLGRVTLTGSVQTIEQRVEVSRMVWYVDGILEIENAIDVLSGAPSKEDGDLALGIVTRLMDDPYISAKRYSIDVSDSKVYLVGLAKNQTELNRVIRHARAESDVRRIISFIRIKNTADGEET